VESEAEALQDHIYREKVARAQEVSIGEHPAGVFECSDLGLEMMSGQIKATHSSNSYKEVWTEAGVRIDRVRSLCDRSIYQTTSMSSVTSKPATDGHLKTSQL
jgi:hypothetical protein